VLLVNKNGSGAEREEVAVCVAAQLLLSIIVISLYDVCVLAQT
jgi:hypothetical protein